jgi:predicted esterase
MAIACSTRQLAVRPQRSVKQFESLFVVALALACSTRGPVPVVTEQPEGAVVRLSVPGYNDAIVSLPSAASSPRPLLVATHGAGDRAEWHCAAWREIVGDRAFVLCPQGRRTDERVSHEDAAYYYADHLALDKEVRAGMQALGAQYPERLDASRAVYTGFSQGAIHGALLIALRPELFPRAALVEGGNGFFNEWSPFAARRFRAGGGERVLFACGSEACVRSAERCAGYLEKTGVRARIAHAQGAGHSYGPAMQAQLEATFEWLVEGDGRWLLD